MKKNPKTKTRAKTALLRSVQAQVNLYCRKRDCFGDEGTNCISCNTWHPFEKGDGGHFIAQGSSSGLRFDERNVNFQCHRCNRYLHGNTHNYYVGMVKKYGQAEVDDIMEHQHDNKKWTEDELKALRTEFRQKIKRIELGEDPGLATASFESLFS